ncbi:MAG TPA: FkbM family methyltransferase [Terriglobia bacterium]
MKTPSKWRGLRRRLQAAWTGITDPFARLSYSQEGEDLILERILEGRDKGFYIDVGAHHPKRFSNTYRFYLKGWSGVNIDATPGSMEPFRTVRPRDRNIEAAISADTRPITFHLYNDPALNSAQPAEVRNIDPARHRVIRQVTVTPRPLSEVLSSVITNGQIIDFLTVDVEGLDLQVLRSNDWQRYRPALVLAEEVRRADREHEGEITEFMRAQHYTELCRTMNTIFFRDDRGRL